MERVFNRAIVTLVLLLSGCGGGSDGGGDAAGSAPFVGVLHGPMSDITESRADWIWGDSVNWLCQQWSIKNNDVAGWFYGTGFSWSNADVFVMKATTDPFSVVAAENFDYTSDSIAADEGDTVFFRGRNGFFGAWSIENIEGGIGGNLSGTWYFKAGGSGDFTGAVKAGDTPIQQAFCSNF